MRRKPSHAYSHPEFRSTLMRRRLCPLSPVPCPLSPGSWLLAPGSWLLAPGSWLLAPCSLLLAKAPIHPPAQKTSRRPGGASAAFPHFHQIDKERNSAPLHTV